MYTFRQTSIRNNRLLAEYVREGTSFEKEIKVETEESDERDPLEMIGNEPAEMKTETGEVVEVKKETEDDRERSREVVGSY